MTAAASAGDWSADTVGGSILCVTERDDKCHKSQGLLQNPVLKFKTKSNTKILKSQTNKHEHHWFFAFDLLSKLAELILEYENRR